jgi:electron transfer flavoprotein alpha subunit
METILLLAHTESDGTLGKAALEALPAAKLLAAQMAGSRLVAGLVGAEVQAAANSIATCGVSRFLGVAGPEFSQSRYSSDVVAAEILCRGAAATMVVAPATSRWSRVLAGVAHRLNGRIDTHVTEATVTEGQPFIVRWYYRQRMEAVMQRAQRPWIILLDPGCSEAWQGAAGTAALDLLSVELPAANKRTVVTGIQAPPADEQTIRPDAKLLFVAGAGWTKTQADGKSHTDDAEKIILDFLHKSKA